MALRLYNTLTKKEQDFRPLDQDAADRANRPPVVTLYTCGPTVYGRPHIGNYTSFLAADLLSRWLEAGHGYVVHQVKNITDVGHLVRDADSGEDKIEKQAREEHGEVTPQSVLAVAKHYEQLYLADEKGLNLRNLEPKNRPHASDYVPQMVTMIESLLRSGHAYVASDGIYFDITSKTPTPYGSLSGNTLENLTAGARVEVNEGKHHPADFALWKFCVGQNEHHVLRWPSPVGLKGETYPEGFPGWHIECSAMSRALLGDQIDLHTGGEDNIFPHHECEIAQSESVTQKKAIRGYLAASSSSRSQGREDVKESWQCGNSG
jgi:cysteinyl-tRNA synthetase